MKINKSQIARELEVDRRTVDKYINGYSKPETRNCSDCITPFYDIIEELLSDKNQQVFYYRKVLWQYLVDNHGFTGVYCNFCHYLRKYPKFDSYFRKSKPANTDNVTIRYETGMSEQAQLDWKESIPFILSSGKKIDVNIFALLLSYSRFRIYRVSLSKMQDILFGFLDNAFETFGGVPHEIVTDNNVINNMKTVMDKARTEYFEGKINNKFRQFAEGNGRMSRLLTTLLLYRNGFYVGKYISLEAKIAKNKDLYYDALGQAQTGWHEGTEDVVPFIKYLLGTILAAYKDFEERFVLVEVKLPALKTVRRATLNKIGRFKKQDIREFCPSLSISSIEGSLRKLVAEGELKREGTGKNTCYYRMK